MQTYLLQIPDLETLGYVVAITNVKDKHDRSTPSNFHWNILKCRMVLFSNSSILACPDKTELPQIHFIFNKLGDDYDKLMSLFMKFSLKQDGDIRAATKDLFQSCFQYTMTAKIAPVWNILGHYHLINNRDFLITDGPQDGVKYEVTSTAQQIILKLQPVKIHFIRSDNDYKSGETIRVLPSLNKAIVADSCQLLPETAIFKCYKDLRRHWKNIHGYRLPEREGSYVLVQFWRGQPLTYPEFCTTRHFPVITPVPKAKGNVIVSKFINCLENKLAHFLGINLFVSESQDKTILAEYQPSASTGAGAGFSDAQAISLCTPTQYIKM